MFTYQNGGIPIKIWMEQQEYYQDTMTVQQIETLSRHPFAYHHIVLTPDGHAGCGMPIGGVLAMVNAVCPNAVGVDIGCGVIAVKTNYNTEELNKEILHKILVDIKKTIPMGMKHQSTNRWKSKAEVLVENYLILCCKHKLEVNDDITLESTYSQLGTLGSGNHFIEIQKDNTNAVWIMMHSGSRNLGYRIANKHAKIAKELCKKYKTPLPDEDLAVLLADTIEGQNYLNDMNFATEFSFQNRLCMLKDIEKILNDITGYNGFDYTASDMINHSSEKFINIHHNFASLENHFCKNVWVHRKGATRVTSNVTGIIPGSMGTSSYIVRGSDNNKESFMSCSHGAGRKMSRTQAKNTLEFNKFQNDMDGIVSLDINKEHQDECPEAYKDIDIVMNNQSDLIEIVHELKPIASCKG